MAAYAPTTPVAPATPPPGFGPPQPSTQPRTQPQQPYPTPPPAPSPAQAHHYAPTRFAAQPHAMQPPQAMQPPRPQPYPGWPGHPAAQPPRNQSRKGAIAVVAAVVLALVGSITAYSVLKDKGQQSQGSGSPQGQDKAGGGASGGTKQNTKADPTPTDHKGINLTAGYHLTLGDEDLRPQQGEDGGYELSYDTGGYLDAETSTGNLVLLDPGQEGSLAACRADTRFTKNLYLNKISKGRQICVTTGTGHMGLVTVQGFSPEGSPSKYMTLDVTVWRNAVKN